jgi:hypothetical protein
MKKSSSDILLGPGCAHFPQAHIQFLPQKTHQHEIQQQSLSKQAINLQASPSDQATLPKQRASPSIHNKTFHVDNNHHFY